MGITLEFVLAWARYNCGAVTLFYYYYMFVRKALHVS